MSTHQTKLRYARDPFQCSLHLLYTATTRNQSPSPYGIVQEVFAVYIIRTTRKSGGKIIKSLQHLHHVEPRYIHPSIHPSIYTAIINTLLLSSHPHSMQNTHMHLYGTAHIAAHCTAPHFNSDIPSFLHIDFVRLKTIN